MVSRHGLGRGLGALLSAQAPATEPAVAELPVDAISPNPVQPRKDFGEAGLAELSRSLKESGVLQPVVVRRVGQGYELIVGERRWRAAKMAGFERIPAMVRDATDAQALELALIENLIREDLNPIEEAKAYQRLLLEFGWTQEQLGQRIGRDRSSVANSLRLLRLPEAIRADLRQGRLTTGHARALLALGSPEQQLRLREEILAHSWSVRATEADVQRKRTAPWRPPKRSAELVAVEDSLRVVLGARVRLIGNDRNGRIEISYTSSDDLDRLVGLMARDHG